MASVPGTGPRFWGGGKPLDIIFDWLERDRATSNNGGELRMQPGLFELVKSKPEVLLRFLMGTGVETFADLRGVWSSSTGFVNEVEAFIEGRLDSDVAALSSRALEFQKRLTKDLVAAREPSYIENYTAASSYTSPFGIL